MRRTILALAVTLATLAAVPRAAEERQAAAAAGAGATARYFASIRNNPSLLLAFLNEMPKGGDLHNHLSGAIYAESYLRWAADDNLCFATATLAIVAGTCDAAGGRPPASTVVQNSVLYSQAIDAMSMRNWDRSLSGHDHFFATFGKFGPASNKTGEMLAEVSARAAVEHVSYLELMLTPDGGIAALKGAAAGWDPDVARMREKLLAASFGDVVTAATRTLDDAEVRRRDLLKCETPQADPGCGVTVRDFSLQMRMLDYLHQQYPRVAITLHAGELVDGLVPPEALRFHISESLRIGHALRIGHGVAVMYEDGALALVKEMAAKRVLVEIALSSNDMILGVKGARHPLQTYLKFGVPVALVTDDAGVARSALTLEFRKAVEEQGVDYPTLKRMARNSLEFSFADAATKTRLRADLDTAFRAFESKRRVP
jgi:hypothetical protein